MKNSVSEKQLQTRSSADTVKSRALSLPAPGHNQVIQRKVSVSFHANDNDENDALSYEKALDESVQQAYLHVLSAPRLDTLANLDGHTAKWVDDFDEAVNGNKTPSSTSFGYVVESLATQVYRPDAPSGKSYQLQGTRGGTRPDVILLDKSRDVSWLDITASKSAGHIYDKEGWKNMSHHSEITYPSLEMGHFVYMKENKEQKSPKGFDVNAFQKQIMEAKKLMELRRIKWKNLGKSVKEKYKKIKINKELGNLHPELYKQIPMLKILAEEFNQNIQDKDFNVNNSYIDKDLEDTENAADFRWYAPYILAALGLTPSTYGFTGGSYKTGESWLLANDPNLAQLQNMGGNGEFDDEKNIDMEDELNN